MAVTSTGSTGSLSTPGIGSGLDVTGLVSKLMAVEQLPLNQIATQQASFQADLSAYGSLKSALSQFQTAAQALETPANFAVTSASSADSTVLSAASSTTAVPGSYSVAVTSLAQAQKLQSSGYASTALTDTGTLSIALGSYATDGSGNISGFTKNTSVDIKIDSTNNTLSGIQKAINAANAGVTASIVSGSDGDHLSLTSNSTGKASQIQLSGISQIAYGAVGTPLAPTSGTKQLQAAADAAITVDGIAATSSSNVFTSAITGVTLTVSKLSATTATTNADGTPTVPAGTTPVPTTVTVAKNNSSIQGSIQSLVNTYNAVVKQISSSTAYDATNKQAAVLTGDSTVNLIQSQLRSLFNAPVSGAASGTSVLSDIGVTFQKDGTLAVDSTKLSAALADPNRDVSKLFAKITSVDSTTLVVSTKSTGYASQIDTIIGKMLGSGGLLTSRTDGINTQITGLGKKSDALNARLAIIQANYMTQFNNLDSMLSSMSSTSSYLTQQLSSLASLTKQSA